MSQSWDSLVATALLGTDRQGTLPAIAEDALAPLLTQLDPTDAEGWILSAAGLLTAYQQAGRCLPQPTRGLPEPSSTEPIVYAAESSLPFLKQIVGGEFREALPEFADLLRQNGQSIPPQYLPQVLDWGSKKTEVQPLVKAIMGQRGDWLARQNPQWAYAIAPQLANAADYPTLWETGDRTTRLNLLKEWRSSNPDAAREQVAATWKQESAKDRAAFLARLEPGLSLADEAFLASVLGDRSKEVRGAAMDLLSMLTASQFSQQMASQVRDYVQVRTGQEKLALEVTLPNPADLHWKQFGLDGLQPIQDMFSVGLFNREMFSKQGIRAGLLMQLLALAPLSVWTEAGTPAQLLGAATHHEWENALTHGWLLATQRQADPDWIEAFLDWSVQTVEPPGRWKLPWPALGALLAQKPLDFQQDWVLQWLQPAVWGGEQLEILSCLPTPWSLRVSQAVLETAQQYLAGIPDPKKARSQAWMIIHPLRQMVYALNADVMETTSTLKATYPQLQTQNFAPLWQVLRFRRQMRRAIAAQGDPPCL